MRIGKFNELAKQLYWQVHFSPEPPHDQVELGDHSVTKMIEDALVLAYNKGNEEQAEAFAKSIYDQNKAGRDMAKRVLYGPPIRRGWFGLW